MSSEKDRLPALRIERQDLRVTPLRRFAFFLAGDIALVTSAVLLAFLLRLEFIITPPAVPGLLFVTAIAVTSTVGALHILGLYQVNWSFYGLRDIRLVAASVAFGLAVLTIATVLWHQHGAWTNYPRSVVFIQAPLAFVGLSGFRLFRRAQRLRTSQVARDPTNAERTLLVGAGDEGEQVLRSLSASGPLATHQVVGFIDDDPLTHQTSIHGVTVLGPVKELGRHIQALSVDAVVICVATAEGAFVRKVVAQCREAGVQDVRIIPPIAELARGDLTFEATRHVSLEDLLGRETIEVDVDDVNGLLQGRVVVVTGGAGTIGSELCRQVARFEPRSLVVLDTDETRLHDTVLSLTERHGRLHVLPALVDVRDREAVEALFRKHSPDVVFHAAAYKHVPMMETWPLAAVDVNVLGTRNVAEAAEAVGCQRMVLVSTDKAVEPSSIMGASKRLAEEVLFHGHDGPMIRSAVRFGNVIGSRGSVIPTFERQIAQGGPLTVTHPDMERFFMMTSEAVSLVLQAAALGKGGDLFVLDMGKPVRILDVAREFCRLKGYEPEADIAIVFTGLRPGEKLVEVLHYPHERPQPTSHPRILRADASPSKDAHEMLQEARDLVEAGDHEVARRYLHDRFPSLVGEATGRGPNGASARPVPARPGP